MFVDSWGSARNGGVSRQRLDALKLPETYRGAKARLGTHFALFRDKTTKRPIPAIGLGPHSAAE